MYITPKFHKNPVKFGTVTNGFNTFINKSGKAVDSVVVRASDSTPAGLGPSPIRYSVPSWHGGTLDRCRAASLLVRLVEGEEKWEPPDHLQGVLPQTWGKVDQNRSVTCMVPKLRLTTGIT
ncbi:hypothetical protein TNCV_975181 [Trichonephila clavipes]|nr:hypothetical protein TNCV_975181 [Trichonephila clavipes]